MVLFPITDFWTLTYHINFAKGGWTERFNLPMQSVTDAKIKSTILIGTRADVLALGFSIQDAVLSQYTKFKDTNYPVGYRYQPINLATEAAIGNVAPCNDPEVGPLIRFDTGLGKFGNRVIRGLRDSWITDNAWVATGTQYTAAEMDVWAGAVANTTTQAQAMGRLLSAILHYTRHVRVLTKTAYTNGVRTMTGESREWLTWQYRRISSHDVGGRYGVGRGRQLAWA